MEKSPSAFRTISEVAGELELPQHVLRFWETKFSQVKPLKRGGGRRYYRPEDVAVLHKVHHLLYKDGFTIKGAQKLIKGLSKNQVAALKIKAPIAEQSNNLEPQTDTTPIVQEVVKTETIHRLAPQQKEMLQGVVSELSVLKLSLFVLFKSKLISALDDIFLKIS